MSDTRLAAVGERADSDAETASRRNVQRVFDAVVAATGGLASFVGMLALVGWILDVPQLRSPDSRVAAMMPHMTVSLVGLGIALVLLRAPESRMARRAGHVIAALVAVFAAAAAAGALLPFSVRLDLVLFPGSLEIAGFPNPGRVSLASTAAVVLLGVALALYDLPSERVHRGAELMVGVVAVIGMRALIGYAFRPDAYEAAGDQAVPIHTAVGLLVLSCGSVLLRTDRGWFRILANPATAGIALRRLLPVSIAGPLLLGWLTFIGVTGDLLTPLTGLTVFMSLVSALLLVAVAWTIGELDRMDGERAALLHREREARAGAEEANGAKSKFLAVISHELRTPLNGILAYADLLEAKPDDLDERQLRYVGRIRRSGNHLRSMIEEILSFTRAQSSSADDNEVRRVDVARLAKDALALIEHEMDGTPVELIRQLPDEAVELETDPEKVMHVLLNLLGNAIKFTEEGRVGIRLLRRRGEVTFEVWDTGPGIPKGDQKRIFQEFTQLERTVGSRRGVGLGLAIARSHATALGGRLEVESWVGRGSLFRFVLPAPDMGWDARRVGARSRGNSVPPLRAATPVAAPAVAEPEPPAMAESEPPAMAESEPPAMADSDAATRADDPRRPPAAGHTG